ERGDAPRTRGCDGGLPRRIGRRGTLPHSGGLAISSLNPSHSWVMESAAVIFFGLIATSLLLCIALAVACRPFGRQAHAALWALAYGLAAANWTASLLKVWLLPAGSELTLLSVVCSVGSFALIALGFRRRAGLPLRLDAILAAAGVTVIFAGGGVWDSV